MPRKVVIIGGGVIGLFCAYSLRKNGLDVVVLDRDRLGQGCSSGNAGWVCPSIALPVPGPDLRKKGIRWLLQADSPLYVHPRAVLSLAPWLVRFWRACTAAAFDKGARALLALAADAQDLYRELVRGGVEFEWHDDGLLMVFHTEKAMNDELDLMRRTGYGPVHKVSTDELFDLEPALAPTDPRPVGGLHVVPEAHVRPESLCRALTECCVRLGVEVQEGFEVEGFRFERGSENHQARCVVGPSAEIEADVFVIATGAEAGRLAALCGTRLPMQAGKGYSITVREPRLALRHALYLAEAKLALTPFVEGHRVGGTMELSGINRRMDRKRLAALRRVAEKALPGVLNGASRQSWVGMRPMTPDGLPVMGRLPSSSNVYVSSGHQMLGMTLAPASGRALASLIVPEDAGRSPAGFDPVPFDPARF